MLAWVRAARQAGRRWKRRLPFLFFAAAAVTSPGIARDETGWVGKPAPGLYGGTWLNSAPLTPADLRGKVVLVEFWTFACENCRHTISHVGGWQARHRGEPFVIIGVHTPELARERNVDALRAEIMRQGITWPVVTDNEERTWDAWHQRYWPVMYLVDKKGIVRYAHIGEGSYDETERMINALIAESP